MSEIQTAAAPNSPCIRLCRIGPSGWCLGCYRTMPEISGWIRLPPAQQWSIVDACERRRRATLSTAVAAPMTP
jgi:hypothetical protein